MPSMKITKRSVDATIPGTTQSFLWDTSVKGIEVTEDILAHTSGTREGVAGVYNKYRYLSEKRIALGLWGEFLRDLRSTTLAAEPHRKWLYADRLKRLDTDAA